MTKQREAVRQIITSAQSDRGIGKSTGYSHTTINKYRKVLKSSKVTWSVIEKMSDHELEKMFKSKRQHPKLLRKRVPDWVYIHRELQNKHMTLQILWEEYHEPDEKTAYGYSWFTHTYNAFRKKLDLSMRMLHKAGEKTFVDYAGTTIPYSERDTGEEYQAQVFVGVLGCSNNTFACAVRSQKIRDWIEAHNRMFQYFGGVTQLLIPDNLKSAVIKAGSLPVLNRTYQELACHYDTIIIPARVRKPQDKSKAEIGVQVVSRWIIARLRKRQFFSLEDINEAIYQLLVMLNERPFKKLPGSRRERFEKMEKPLLKPLPPKPFEYAEWLSPQKIGPDYHVHVHGHYYSVPYALVGERVEARVTSNIVEILFSGRRVASHISSDKVGEHTTKPEHMPKAHRYYAEQTPGKMKAWAKAIGPASLSVVQYQFSHYPHDMIGLKACSTLNRLASSYGDIEFEAACRRAVQIGSLTVKSVRSILQHGLSDLNENHVPKQMNLPFHHNLRGSEYYVDKEV